MDKKKINLSQTLPSLALMAAALSVSGTLQASTPTCSSPEFDSDGDGWGWENHRSCVITSDAVVQIQSLATDEPAIARPSYLDRHPACTGTNPDPDGDGWGWENQQSCYLLNGVTNPVVINDDESIEDTDAAPVVIVDKVETNPATAEESAPVVAINPPKYSKPVCELASSDPDGDGWGWENSRSCIVVAAQDYVEDTDADEPEYKSIDDTNTEDTTDAESDEPNTTVGLNADAEKDGSPIVYQQNFESAVDGLYQSDQLNESWNQPFWHLGFDQGRVQIVSDASRGQTMQVTFPAGAYGSNGASAFLSDVQFAMELPKTYDELYLSYDMKFDDDFEFVLGGKLPGLCGANSDSALTEGCNTGGGKPNGFDGWSARGMWRVDGALEHYTYHAGQQNYWADSMLWNVKAKRGKWHRVQHRVVLNTVGASNGILEAWIDGQKVLSNTQLEYRKTESVGINLFYFSTFFGGNDPSWAPQTDQILYFDNFVISTEKTN